MEIFKYEDIERLRKEVLASEFVVGSCVWYPIVGETDRYYKGIIEKVIGNRVTIKDDRNPRTSETSENVYDKWDLQPVFITEASLLGYFNFLKHTNKTLYGRTCEELYEKEFGEGRKIQIIKEDTASYGMVVPSDSYYGFTSIHIPYVHNLQRIISVYDS